MAGMSPSERAQILAMLSALVEPLHLSIPGSNGLPSAAVI